MVFLTVIIWIATIYTSYKINEDVRHVFLIAGIGHLAGTVLYYDLYGQSFFDLMGVLTTNLSNPMIVNWELLSGLSAFFMIGAYQVIKGHYSFGHWFFPGYPSSFRRPGHHTLLFGNLSLTCKSTLPTPLARLRRTGIVLTGWA